MMDHESTSERRLLRAHDDVRTTALQAVALTLRMDLWPYEKIAEVLGVSKHEAHRMVKCAMQRQSDIKRWLDQHSPAMDHESTSERRLLRAHDDVPAIALQAVALTLWTASWPYAKIAEALGVSEHEARRMVNRAMQRSDEITCWFVDDPPAMEQLERAEEVNSERNDDGTAKEQVENERGTDPNG